MASYAAIAFTGATARLLALSQLTKHTAAWFIPCWMAGEVVAMNTELYASGRFFPANMHGDRGASHALMALLWNSCVNYLGIFFAPTIQMRHRLMLGGKRFLLWSSVWVPVRTALRTSLPLMMRLFASRSDIAHISHTFISNPHRSATSALRSSAFSTHRHRQLSSARERQTHPRSRP